MHMCSQVFDSEKGGRAKLEKLDDELAQMDERPRDNRLKKHAKGTVKCAGHHGQQLRRAPLLPVHHFVFDPMHGVHNEANILLDEAVHKHLMVESSDAAVKKVIEEATR